MCRSAAPCVRTIATTHALGCTWRLEPATRLAIRGGSPFKAMAGFGPHPTLHEARGVKLAGPLAVEVEFIATSDSA
jgi:PII-like signaling protein